jgi:hypothetical protein
LVFDPDLNPANFFVKTFEAICRTLIFFENTFYSKKADI